MQQRAILAAAAASLLSTLLVATPVAASALSTDQPWYRSRITVSTGSSTGPTPNGLIWMSIE